METSGQPVARGRARGPGRGQRARRGPPEVEQELHEGLHSARQRHDDVDDHALRLHRRAAHLHQGPEGPEERDVAEAAGVLLGEEELVQRAFVPLRPVQPCRPRGRHTGDLTAAGVISPLTTNMRHNDTKTMQ